jgi:hypothetical protein
MAHHESPQKQTDEQQQSEENGGADALAAIALITLFVCAMSFWLHGMT